MSTFKSSLLNSGSIIHVTRIVTTLWVLRQTDKVDQPSHGITNRKRHVI
jgi:hypothetical protein